MPPGGWCRGSQWSGPAARPAARVGASLPRGGGAGHRSAFTRSRETGKGPQPSFRTVRARCLARTPVSLERSLSTVHICYDDLERFSTTVTVTWVLHDLTPNSCHFSLIPFSSKTPRSTSSMPEPTIKSFTVLETRISLVSARLTTRAAILLSYA